MTALLTTLGGKIPDRWVSLLLLPGLLFASVAVGGRLLGHGHPFDPGRLLGRIDDLADAPAAQAPGTAALATALVLTASPGISLLAATLGRAVERLWLGDWPRPLAGCARALTRRRERRWAAAQERYRAALAARARHALSGDAGDPPDTVALNEARNRIALARPRRPTWMGDRLTAVDTRIHETYDLDLGSAWPRLWLLLPDTPRGDVHAARSALTDAARRAAWGVLYAVPALWWWPAALAAAVACAGAWRQGRLAVAEFAELVEATVDVHGRDLASALGIPCEERLTRDVGLEITRALRKGT
ncbi:hypothetical protein [Streptomyces hoynatensis]|uniref:Vegetative cell wall protein gp1 n=1 Tax=Streptomyces hoynatensis TaxID=1141874 RepID=A0A3A9ZE89_9ACTN|nr:hypothetical protein [Streptomyces hoynatensis]RKN45567.1 hypothetical protein D7294_03540 [Streptomyces hoynatensis]